MIEYRSRQIVFECDGCGDTFESRKRELHKALTEVKKHRWRYNLSTLRERWVHWCPKCKRRK